MTKISAASALILIIAVPESHKCLPWMKPPGTICPWTRCSNGSATPGSACGEQLLYYQLRCPAMNEEEYRRRAELIRLVEEDPALRQKLQELLFRLGKSNAARTEEVFSPARQGKGRLFLALLLFFGLLISGFSLLFTRATLPLSLFVLLLCANPLYHVFMTKHLDTHLPSARYSAALAAVYTRIRALENSALTAWLAPYEEAGRRAPGIGPFRCSVNDDRQ